jgi:hypothetical protein
MTPAATADSGRAFPAARSARQYPVSSLSDVHLEVARVQLFQQRADIWMRILGRESVASVVGSLLLVAFASALTVAMFTGVTVTTVVSNSFLLILGYFFGQGVSRRKRRTSPLARATRADATSDSTS